MLHEELEAQPLLESLFLRGSTTEIHVVTTRVVLVLLLYNQPNFSCWWQPNEKNPVQSATKSSQQPDTGRLARFLFDFHESASCSSTPIFPALFVVCTTLYPADSLIFWIKSANPHCHNSGITPPFHCAIHAPRRHRLLLQSLDTHAAVVQTRGRRGVL